jgi:NADPH:quinone reductase-like Zn-dependent oxidoreductase
MRAAVLHTHGEPPSYASCPDPEPAPGESLVRVTAAPLVPLDLLCGSGTSYFGPPEVPYVPGVQGVGVVERSDSLVIGSRVWFATSAGMRSGNGSLAERVAVARDDLVPVRVSLEDTAVAALGLSAVAAWMSLTWKARLRAGERVLVLGGGGAVGQVAIGAARLLGAERVVAACRSEAGAERASDAGADAVVRTSGGADDLVDRLRDACGGQVDVVVDPVFGATASAASRVMAEGGRLVNLGNAAGDEAFFSSALLRSRSLEFIGYTTNALTPAQRREALGVVCAHAATGDLAVAHEVHPLADIEALWQRQASGDAPARFVLRP